MNLYQPIPFEGYEVESTRKDCLERYDAIRKHVDPKGLTLIDVGCANGYFMFRFLQDGGKYALGIETDFGLREIIRGVAHKHNMRIETDASIPSNVRFDVAIYLDLHFHDGTDGYLEKIKGVSREAFISPAKQHLSGNLVTELEKLYKSITLVYEGDYGRNIYKCL